MSNIFGKPETECSYLDGASETWYIVHKTAFTLPYPVDTVSNRAGRPEKEDSRLEEF